MGERVRIRDRIIESNVLERMSAFVREVSKVGEQSKCNGLRGNTTKWTEKFLREALQGKTYIPLAANVLLITKLRITLQEIVSLCFAQWMARSFQKPHTRSQRGEIGIMKLLELAMLQILLQSSLYVRIGANF